MIITTSDLEQDGKLPNLGEFAVEGSCSGQRGRTGNGVERSTSLAGDDPSCGG